MSILLDLSPFHNNLGACLVMVLYFKISLEIIYWLRSLGSNVHYSRDIMHMLMSSCILFWSLFDSYDWSWRLVALVPAVLMARFIYKGSILKDAEDIEVQALSRSSSPSELLFGPLQCAAVLVWTSWNFFDQPEAACVVAASLAVTDGLAPMIGKLYGRHVYHHSDTKRKEGTIVGVFLGTVLYCYLYQWCMGLALAPLRVVLVYGGIASIVGTLFKGLDNLAVPIALHLLAPRVLIWLPE